MTDSSRSSRARPSASATSWATSHGKRRAASSPRTRASSRASSSRSTASGRCCSPPDKVEYFSAAFFLRNPLAGGLAQDALSIARERFVGDGMQDAVRRRRTRAWSAVEFELGLEVGCDFADIFAVKDFDFALGDPLRAKPLPEPPPVDVRRGAEPVPDLDDDGDLPRRRR